MKGVSPVVATVLMVAVAIAAAVVAYSWFMSMQASVQAEASRGAGTVGKERIVVEAVQCDGTNLHVFVRNIGEENITTSEGNFTVVVKDASTGIIVGTVDVAKDVPAGATAEFTINVGDVGINNNCQVDTTGSNRIIVEVTSPGGTVASKQERIS